MSLHKITPTPVRKSVRVKVSQARAFKVFTLYFNSWWPRDHHIGASELAETVLEPRKDGRWYEKGIDGSIHQWGEVLVWDPPAKLVMSWRINSSFKLDDTVESEVEVRFTADSPQATLVELEHRITAVDADKLAEAVGSDKGWAELLKVYAEKTETV